MSTDGEPGGVDPVGVDPGGVGPGGVDPMAGDPDPEAPEGADGPDGSGERSTRRSRGLGTFRPRRAPWLGPRRRPRAARAARSSVRRRSAPVGGTEGALPWSPWWRSAIAVALLALVALVLDAIAPLVRPVEELPVGALDPSAGGWVCAVGDDRVATAVDVSLTAVPRIVPPGESAGPAVAGRGTVVTVGGIWRELDVASLLPAEHVVVDAEVDEGAALWAGWADLPLVAWREWALSGSPDLPSGRVVGGCANLAAALQVVPGVRTDGGFETRLRLGNPFGEDAAVGITFLTPTGVEEPLGLRNVSVPAYGTREVVVSEHLPQAADIAAVVTVRSGRVGVEGYLLARPAIGGVRGVTLLPASTADAEEVTVPWVSQAAGTTTTLWLANTGARAAVAEFTVHLPTGAEQTGPTEVDVAAGAVVPVEAATLLPIGVSEAAITVRSEGAPLHVAAGTVVRDVDVARTGIATQLGAGRDDRRWVVAGRGLDGRSEEVILVNRDVEPAEVMLLLDVLSEREFQFVRTRRAVGPFTLAPGATQRVRVDPGVAEVRSWSATVTATGGRVVVGRVGEGVERLDLVAVVGVSAQSWALPERLVQSSPRPGLVRRIGTALGVRDPGPIETGSPVG
ncbi:MAG: hypothetical protein RLZZ272_190 [Actinomycetota bacterium]